MIYKAQAPGILNGVPAAAVGALKEEIASECGGVVPTDVALARITHPCHPCHCVVGWDTEAMAHEMRLQQMARVLQTVVAVMEDDEPPLRDIGGIVVALTGKTAGVDETVYQGYMPVYEVLANTDYTEQAERAILRRVLGDLRNHGELPLMQELLAVATPIADAWEKAHRK